MIRSVRGAVKIEQNNPDSIRESVTTLMRRVLEENRIEKETVINIVFSQTEDLTALNPASALRSDGYDAVPLFCTQEPKYEGSMPRVIRVLVTFETDTNIPAVPVYLNGAETLRSDLFDS